MNAYKSQLFFFIAVLLLVLAINFLVFSPFFSSLFLAIIFAVVFNPLYSRILFLLKNRKNLASTVMVSIIAIIVIMPVMFFGFLIIKDAQELYLEATVLKGDSSLLKNAFGRALSKIEEISPNASFDIKSYAKQGAGFLVRNIGSIFSSTFNLILNIFLFVLALFFLFRDGDKFKDRFVELSPLRDTHDNTVLKRLEKAVNSVVRGALLIAIVQGLVSGVGFSIFGLPNPVFWGSVTVVAALVPFIGTSLVNIPAVMFLFLSGNTNGAIGLFIWAILAVGFIDNILGPIFMKKGLDIHPFLILVSVLGGLTFFGPIGLVAGPVTLSLLFSLFDIYPLVTKGE